MDEGMMTPCGYSIFYSYVENLYFLAFKTDGDINEGAAG
jgi:hypothetical protein